MKKIPALKIIFEMGLEYGFYLFAFLLPWQARYFLREGSLSEGYWEYGTFSLYALDIVFIVLVIMGLGYLIFNYRLNNPDKFSFKYKSPGFIFFVFFLLVCFGSIVWAEEKSLALYTSIRVLQGVLLIALLYISKVRITRISFALLMGGVLQAYLAINQFFLQSDILGNNKWLGVSAHDPSEAGVSVIETDIRRWLRAYGTLLHPNILGGFLMVGLLLVFEWYTDIYYRIYESVSNSKVFQKIKIEVAGAVVSFVIILFGLFSTFSRSAFLGVIVSFLFYFLFRIVKKNSSVLWFAGKTSFIKTGIIAVLIIVSFSLIYAPVVKTRLFPGSRLEKKSISERIAGKEESKELIRKNYILGVGAGNYTYAVSKQVVSSEPSWYYQPVHNIYLLLISEFGFLGWILLVYISVLLILEFKKLWNTKMTRFTWAYLYYSIIIGFLVIGVFDHYLWSLYFGQMLLFLVLGIYIKARKSL